MSAMLLFGLIWAVLITFVKHHSKMSADTIISVFSSTSIALGLVVRRAAARLPNIPPCWWATCSPWRRAIYWRWLLALVGTIVC